MSNIEKDYKKIIENLDNNIKDKSDLEYAKTQISVLTNMFVQEIQEIQELTDSKIEAILQNMVTLENKVSNVAKSVQTIEKDIYEQEDCDFEIVCPYCNNEFMVEYDELKDEIKCPECNNTIELDWTGECDDEQGCSCCGHEENCNDNCNCNDCDCDDCNCDDDM